MVKKLIIARSLLTRRCLYITHSFSVISEIIIVSHNCQKLDSLDYIFVADSMGLALSSLTQLTLKLANYLF